MSSPTARTLAECRKRNWHAGVVERYNTFSGKKNDLFGFIDLVALDGQPGLLGIQATSTPNMSSREKKIRIDCAELAHAWLMAGNRLEVWGWGKRVHYKKDGSKSKVKRWALKTTKVRL